jgi:hypothetical protein
MSPCGHATGDRPGRRANSPTRVRRWEADDVAFRDVLRLSIIPKAWQPIASDDPMDMRMGSLAAC